MAQRQVVIAWKGVGDGVGRLNLMSSEDLSSWSEKQTLDDTCIGGPALASYNGQLLLAWTGGGGLGGGEPDRRLNIAESAGGDWAINRKTFGYDSDAGPALCASRRVRLGFVGRNRQLFIARATADTLGSGNGIKLSKFGDQPPNPYHPANANAVETSFARPALAAEITERHWAAWAGDGNTQLNSVLADFQDFDQSDHYGGKRTYTDTTNAAPALLAGALNTSERTAVVAWRGTDAAGKINVARLDELRAIYLQPVHLRPLCQPAVQALGVAISCKRPDGRHGHAGEEATLCLLARPTLALEQGHAGVLGHLEVRRE